MPSTLSIPVFALLLCSAAGAQTSVLTDRYDSSRTGWNPNEKALTTANVTSSGFGKLYSYPVDGSVFAQPLYVPNVAISGQGNHNVLYVVTMNDSVYAFDADQNVTLWKDSFINTASGVTPIPISDITGSNTFNIVGLVGIESTPVIDPSTNTMYLVARTKEVTATSTNYVQRLHAIDITSGAEKFGGPVAIAGSVPGTGEQSSGGVVTFDPFWQNQRAALALANGQVIIIWSSHEDDQPYHGWVMSYSASTLAQTGIFCDTPNGSEGGIWMSGRGPVVSSGNVYLITGNGTTDSKNDFGESVLRLTTNSGGLTMADFFTASNASSLNNGDIDLGSSGLVLLPQANLLVGGGKQGILYLLNPSNLGHYAANDTQIPQKFQAVSNLIFAGPSYWQSASKGQLLYIWAQNDVMKAYAFNGSTFNTTPAIESTVKTSTGADPGGTMTISSSGTTDSTGIVWASMTISGDEDHGVTPGILRAVNAVSGAELWNSQMVPARDSEGAYLAKFVPPIVENGKVYMATFTDYVTANSIAVYGLLSASPKFTLSVTPPSLAIAPGAVPAVYTVTVAPAAGHSFTGAVRLALSALPAGVTGSFSPAVVNGAGTSTLTVTASAAAALGQSTITVTGTGAKTGVTATDTASLTITNQVGAISVNFVGNSTPLHPTDIAGVVAKSQWNNVTGFTGTVNALTDEFGNGTTVSMTYAGDNPWELPTTASTANEVMMQGYLDDETGAPVTLTFSALPELASGYTVYVYSDGDNGTSLRTATYSVSGSGVSTQTITNADLPNTNFSGTFRQSTSTSPAGNYVVFSVPGGAFTVTATPVISPRAPINAVQIIPN